MAIERVKVEFSGLYRYAEKKWNDALVQRGSVRIGTLHDYRRAEHKPGISDAYEGQKWIYHHINHWNSANEIPGLPSLHARASAMLGLEIEQAEPGEKRGGITLQNVSFISAVEYPNCFIHCTSYKLSKEVMAEFEGADSCVKLRDHRAFYRALTVALNKHTPVRAAGINIVRYQDRREPCNGDNLGIDPCWVKGKDFSAQYEVRAIWHSLSNEPIDWVVLEVPELIGLTQRVKVR